MLARLTKRAANLIDISWHGPDVSEHKSRESPLSNDLLVSTDQTSTSVIVSH